ncbi:MAG TPA: hypothetical protein VJU17_03125, partial [Gemmatimonadales bacterium]|nr:hypothetical protein [Gemmatimonadales bacterium]
RRNPIITTTLAGILMAMMPSALHPQAPKDDPNTALAKATQNPVADLISLPFQFNFNTGGGFEDRTFFLLNFQPVIPVKGLLQRWNIIARTIIPYVSMPVGATRQGGLGDIQGQFFFTPAKPGGLIWGVGPQFSVPTATADAVATGSWALGPTGLVLKSSGPWVAGALINNVWTFADQGDAPEVNQFLLQLFINYNFGKGWALASAPIITANWDAPNGEEWTVPLGLGFSRTTAFNNRPMTIGVQYYHNVEHPTASAADVLRVQISLLYPPRPKSGREQLP